MSQVATIIHLTYEPFASDVQQALETFSLFVLAFMLHLGIFKISGSDHTSRHFDAVVFLLQLNLNAGLTWRFLSSLTKDMLRVLGLFFQLSFDFTFLITCRFSWKRSLKILFLKSITSRPLRQANGLCSWKRTLYIGVHESKDLRSER